MLKVLRHRLTISVVAGVACIGWVLIAGVVVLIIGAIRFVRLARQAVGFAFIQFSW